MDIKQFQKGQSAICSRKTTDIANRLIAMSKTPNILFRSSLIREEKAFLIMP